MKNSFHFRTRNLRRKSTIRRPSYQLKKENIRRSVGPTFQQNNQLIVLLQLIEANRHKPKAVLIDILAKLGYTASDMRIYKSGGVGTYRWMPKFSKYRLQIAATHCSNYGYYMPYALCVQF